ncbi:gibberellin 20 oxidase 2 [Cajanus cajan]|uniref:Gibberellin 20 oxidase 2 n=1 Tax=Cajanus cajan TaxID=3821 RepID=A0A151TLE3_CAJCA|nr:gibberellin 20 oxidase 2 [Cajanus cajan]KYP67873.1 Gibberellin 20 oxidase 2 [Cajanus cajan]
MESNTSTLVVPTPSTEVSSFDFKSLNNVPKQFVWSSKDLIKGSSEKLNTPLIDLKAIKGDEIAMANAAKLVREACMKHGFFEVTKHGVDHDLIIAAHREYDSIFKLPLEKKLSAKNKHNRWGYSSAHAERYSSSLPWKETFTFLYHYIHESDSEIVDLFKSFLGDEFEQAGLVNQRYCEAMKEVSMNILELLGISLGADHSYFQRFFEDGEAIMRCNHYPSCKNPNLTLGVGPHCDPTSLTILHQEQVSGLEVYVDGKWLPVPPRHDIPDALIINIGDTFKALTNGVYKSVLHRVVVNEKVNRKSLTFFLNPRADKTVIPPKNLFENEEQRDYLDFTWTQLYEFTQKRHRADPDTLSSFVLWLGTQEPPPSN